MFAPFKNKVNFLKLPRGRTIRIFKGRSRAHRESKSKQRRNPTERHKPDDHKEKKDEKKKH